MQVFGGDSPFGMFGNGAGRGRPAGAGFEGPFGGE